MPRLIKRLCFIDDDPDCRRQWLEWAKDNGYTAKAFESAFEANQYVADCYVFDISAVGGFSMDHAYAPIARLIEDHPGAEIIVGSAMSRNAVEDALDEVEQAAGRRPLFFDASYGFEGLEAVLKKVEKII